MFKEIITTTQFTSEQADAVFNCKITGASYFGDVSFLSTLRALVYPRMKEGDTVSFRVDDFSCYGRNFRDSKDALIRLIKNNIYYHSYVPDGCMNIIGCGGTREEIEDCFGMLDTYFEESTGKEYLKIQKVTDFFRKSFNVLCYVHTETKKTVVFVENLNRKKYHCLQCGIFAMLPWYFKPEDGVTQEEMNLIQSLRESSPEKYIEAINVLAQKYDFRSVYIKEKLKGIEFEFHRRSMDSIRNRLRENQNNIESFNSRIASCLREIRDLEIKLLGLEMKVNSSSEEMNEIMEYFLCNKKIELGEVNGSTIKLVVKDYVTYFDEDIAESVINNRGSYIYERCDSFDEDDVKLLMTELFLNQSIKIRMCSAYRFDIGERICGIAEFPYGSEYSTYMPNPHIDRFACLGSYGRTMNEAIARNDHIGAIEQCVCSCKGLNFADSTVMREFMRKLLKRDYGHSKCIELPNGDIVKAKEAIEWLKEQKESEE